MINDITPDQPAEIRTAGRGNSLARNNTVKSPRRAGRAQREKAGQRPMPGPSKFFRLNYPMLLMKTLNFLQRLLISLGHRRFDLLLYVMVALVLLACGLKFLACYSSVIKPFSR